MQPFAATTENITVTVRAIFLEEQSDVMARKFVFAYFVKIDNQRDEEVKLLRRHWFIINGNGDKKEVEGEGVVGVLPVILPGFSHEYNSFCVLETFEGLMEGTYLMQRPDGELFYIVIPRFALRASAN